MELRSRVRNAPCVRHVTRHAHPVEYAFPLLRVRCDGPEPYQQGEVEAHRTSTLTDECRMRAVIGHLIRPEAPQRGIRTLRPIDRHLPFRGLARTTAAHLLAAAVPIHDEIHLLIVWLKTTSDPTGKCGHGSCRTAADASTATSA